ncbi:nitroreductase [Methanoregula boonei 6A8]|uniref:Nitroreductase n=1 Tax=Methanoregula boonei (strain DSM 21154 / JCM 14090 / 6A8) TaxID=456442 RepID=A7I8W6_METB6|nr:nitroreductase family protein [Methanoregula boonei]ABS56177.1 nitroreductase [Methanoregula boonei 6A8]
MDSSDFKKFVSGRVSVRDFQETALCEDEISYIVSCAGTAPSAGNLEAWDVVVVTDAEARFALAKAAFGQEHVGAAPALFVVCANYVRSMSQYGERGILYAVQDATIACTYMMLAAHSHGLSSCWTGAFEEDDVREILDLPPHVRPLALLATGYGREPSRRAGRMEIGEHLHYETW